MALIENCSCGQDHEKMPQVDISPCCCLWAGEDPTCNHEEILVDAVCLKHKRHEPCRRCLAEEKA